MGRYRPALTLTKLEAGQLKQGCVLVWIELPPCFPPGRAGLQGGRGEDMNCLSCGQQTCPKLEQRVSSGGARGALTHLSQVLAPACSGQPCEMWQMRAVGRT